MQAAQDVPQGSDRDSVLRRIATRHAELGQIQEAVNITETIQEIRQQELAQTKIAKAWVRSGQRKRGLWVARELTSPDLRAQVLAEIAQMLAIQNQQVAQQILREATRTYQQHGGRDMDRMALPAITLANAALGQADTALELALRSDSAYQQQEMLTKIVPTILPMTKPDRVLHAIDRRVEARERDRILLAVVQSLTEAGQNEHALTVAEEIASVTWQARALRAVALTFASRGNERGKQLLEKAWDLTLGLAKPAERRAALATVIASLTLAGQLETAQQLVADIEDHKQRVEAYLQIVQAAAYASPTTLERELLDDLVKATTYLPAQPQAEALYQLVEILQDVDSCHLDPMVEHLMQAALGIYPATEREMMLLRIANNLRVRSEEALEAAGAARDEGRESMGEWHARQWEEQWIAQLVEDQQTRDAVSLARSGEAERALDVARRIDSRESQSRTLRTLVETLARGSEVPAAEELAREIGDPQLIATTVAYTGKTKQALAVLGLCPLEIFVETVAFWGPVFDRLERGLSVETLREVTRIAGWVRPAWRQVYLALKDVRPPGR